MDGRVQIVLVPVSGRERARDIYENSLGFELRAVSRSRAGRGAAGERARRV